MRRLLIILGGLFASAVLALLALPWWLGPVLKTAGARWGLSFAAYERVGYARFALHDVVFKHPAVRVTAERVESDAPLLWIWRHRTGNSGLVTATRWQVEVTAPEAAAGPVPPAPSRGGAMPLRRQLLDVAAQLDRWLPRIEAGAGAVRWQGGELKIASATWQRRSLQVRRLSFGGHAADVTATFPTDGVIAVDAAAPDKTWRTDLQNRGNELTGIFRVWEQVATLTAHFAERGWLPASAAVRAANWTMPGVRLKLGKSYSAVRGEAHLDWNDGRFETSVDVSSDALAGSKTPPLTVKLRGRGDPERFTVESLFVEAPGVLAKLSAPVELDRHGAMRSGAAVFTVAVDLAKQPWFAAQGSITGEARLTPREGGVPQIDAKLDGRDMTFREWSGVGFTAEVALEWPRLQLKTATIALNQTDRLALHGEWDFQAKELTDIEATGAVRGATVARWLPATVGFGTVTFATKAHGPLAALQHEGTARATGLTVRALHPLALDVAWRGTGAAVEISEARARAGASELTLAGSFDATGAKLSTLRFNQGGSERLALAQPATIRWSPPIAVGPLELAGAEGSLALALAAGGRGRAEATARNISSAWCRDFVALTGPEWRVSSLAVKGQWDGGPMGFTANGELAVLLAPERFAAVSFAARGDAEGVKIETLRVAEGAAPILTATGRVPLVLRPDGAGALVQFDEAAPLELHAVTASNPDFWKRLFEATGWEFQEPEITVGLSGTWAHPRGEVRARVARLAADPQRIKWPFPTVENLEAHAVADRAGVTIDRLVMNVDGQAVSASGQLPLSPQRWGEFKGDPLPFVRKEGNFHLEIPDAQVAAIARYVPAWLAPAGRLHLDVMLKPGGDLQGTLRLQGAVSRPLGPLGVLQEIQAEVQLNGRSVEVRSLTAQSGGQPVKLTGTIQWPLDTALKYDLALKGENLPLVRQTGLLLRADLDLKLVTQGDGVPAVTGAVKLRDSVFLSDVRALIPRGGTNAPSRRPPFFAFENPPLNAWRLNVELGGERFLRLRSTMFVGVASARFRLTGTLGDPRATGEAVVDTGRVLLPFATFKIERGAVRLTEADPYALGLFVSGTARRYGYDLRMEITGTAAQPVVVFSSSPPLQAQQVLLMVMAGEMPHDEIVYGASQRAARLGAYLGQSLISSIGGDSSEAERLSISTGERVTRQGRETYNIEYRLNDRFSLVGEYDEFDDYNAGVKWGMLPPEKAPAKKAATSATGKEETAP
jgi:translocation and assembly module TamB